jgi:hypothetical protein
MSARRVFIGFGSLKMDFHTFLAVIPAAVLHTGWNLMLKLDTDRFLSLFLIGGHGPRHAVLLSARRPGQLAPCPCLGRDPSGPFRLSRPELIPLQVCSHE